MAKSFKGATLLWLLAALVMPIALQSAFYRAGLDIPFFVLLLAVPICGYFAYQNYRQLDAVPVANTVKPAVVFWILGAFPLWSVAMRQSENIGIYVSPLLGFVVVLSLCCAFAARAYKQGQAGTQSKAIKPAYAIAAVAGLAVITGATWYTTRLTIEGKYRTSTGASAEFLSNGTLIFVADGQQGVWKWAVTDGNRMKLDPDAGMLGTRSTVCDYTLLKAGMSLRNCTIAMNLTRL